MKYNKQLKILVPFIIIGSIIEALAGILSNSGRDSYLYETLRGEMVETYGRGVSIHMTTDVAIQGIVQRFKDEGIAADIDTKTPKEERERISNDF